jgi:glycogen debranching enzyme
MEKAAIIARDALRECYGPRGIYAGLHQFRDYWARDGLFAIWGALAIQDEEIAEKELYLMFDHIKKGQVPLRVGKSTTGVVMAGLGFHIGRRKPIYHIDKSRAHSIDQNALLIIATYEYLKKTGKRIVGDIRAVIDWYEHRLRKGLVWQSAYTDWADSVAKRGNVLYTNVLYCHALWCAGELLEDPIYHQKSEKVKMILQERFWTGEFFLDWIEEKVQYSYFDLVGNALAVLWSIADPGQAQSILDYAHMHHLDAVPSQCGHPLYPLSLISNQTELLGMGGCC